jgi:hypothetical protein
MPILKIGIVGYPPVITPIPNQFEFIDSKPAKGWKQKGYLDGMG